MHPIEAHTLALAIHHERLAEAERARLVNRLRANRTTRPAANRSRQRRSHRHRRTVADRFFGWRTA